MPYKLFNNRLFPRLLLYPESPWGENASICHLFSLFIFYNILVPLFCISIGAYMIFFLLSYRLRGIVDHIYVSEFVMLVIF